MNKQAWSIVSFAMIGVGLVTNLINAFASNKVKEATISEEIAKQLAKSKE